MTDKDQKEQLEKMQENARKTLKGINTTLGIISYLESQGSRYGEAIREDIEKQVYDPLKRNEDGQKFIQEQIRNSRINGKRYTGDFNEGRIMENARRITQEALSILPLGEVLKMMGSKEETINSYGDLTKSPVLEFQGERGSNPVIQAYFEYKAKQMIADAEKKAADETRSGLEEMLKEVTTQGNRH